MGLEWKDDGRGIETREQGEGGGLMEVRGGGVMLKEGRKMREEGGMRNMG